MAFTQSELLDDLNTIGHELLDDVTITIKQNRPQSVIDPSTRSRTVDITTQSQSVGAVEGFDGKQEVGGRWVRVRSWIVDASTLGFVPSRQGLVIDGQSVQWRIYKVERRNNHREYELFGELVS